MDFYMFILSPDSSIPVCLICSETMVVIKSGYVKHHYEIKYHWDIANVLWADITDQIWIWMKNEVHLSHLRLGNGCSLWY